jgi:hypothetical protein
MENVHKHDTVATALHFNWSVACGLSLEFELLKLGRTSNTDR